MKSNEPAAVVASVWHSGSADEAIRKLSTDRQGLSPEEARSRLSLHGPNRLPESRPRSPATIFFKQFLNPLIYVLLLCALISLALGHLTDAGFILGVLALNAIIGTVQEAGAEKSAHALRALVQAKAHVRRGGLDREIDASELVPGDIVLLESGTKVPADLRLIMDFDLEIDESLLTGESFPVGKHARATVAADAPVGDRNTMGYAATWVTRGRATGVVVATGETTEIGRIARSLTGQRPSRPPLLVRMESFTRNLAFVLLVFTLLVAGFLLAQGTPPVEVLLVSVALAVSVIPEGLPVAVTVALAIAVSRMSRRRVITRNLAAVEALGSCTFIASDKTGTLTVNELTIRQLRLPSFAPLQVSGEGYRPEGRIGPPQGPVPVGALEAAARLATAGALCNEGYLGFRDGQWLHHGDAVDVAFLVLAEKLRESYGSAVRPSDAEQLDALPFESKRAYAASAFRFGDGTTAVLVKGAPEKVAAMCGSDGLEGVEADAHSMAEQGYRVLALARGELPADWDNTLSAEDLKGLEFLGLAGMIDPLRSEAREAVARCHAAGIRVAMVTGDHPVTALAIARELGLGTGGVVTGPMLREALARGRTEEIDRLTRDARVFARVEPEQKLEIVRSLTRNGHFVAVTGDGVNDAPALKEAHVGVAMGRGGTDVARESADLILTDDNFSSIIGGVEEGRIAYGNVRKLIYMLLATGAAELIVFIGAIVSGLPMPLTAVQLLWLNVVTNGVQDIALAFEPGEGDELQRPPRPVREPIFNRLMVERVIISALAGGVLAYGVFDWMIADGADLASARNSVLLYLVLYENILLGTARTETKSVFALNPLRNRFLLSAAIVAQFIHLGAMNIPAVGRLIGAEPVSVRHWLALLALNAVLIAANELYIVAKKLRSAA